MKESYGEGLATHADPESCGAASRGDAFYAGHAIDPRKGDLRKVTCSHLLKREFQNNGDIQSRGPGALLGSPTTTLEPMLEARRRIIGHMTGSFWDSVDPSTRGNLFHLL